MGLEWSI